MFWTSKKCSGRGQEMILDVQQLAGHLKHYLHVQKIVSTSNVFGGSEAKRSRWRALFSCMTYLRTYIKLYACFKGMYIAHSHTHTHTHTHTQARMLICQSCLSSVHNNVLDSSCFGHNEIFCSKGETSTEHDDDYLKVMLTVCLMNFPWGPRHGWS